MNNDMNNAAARKLMKYNKTIQDILNEYIGKKVKIYLDDGDSEWWGILTEIVGNWLVLEDNGKEIVNLEKVAAIQLDYDYDNEDDEYDDDDEYDNYEYDDYE